MNIIRRQMKLSQIVLAISLVLIAASSWLVIDFMDKSKILPSKENRYDLTRVELATFSDICPGAQGQNAMNYEDCIDSMDENRLSSFVSIAIPDLDQVIAKGRPDFSSIVRQHSQDLHDRILKNGESFVVKLDIPAKLYSNANHTTDYNELVFSYMRNAVACVDSNCAYPINFTTWGTNTIPLYSSQESGGVLPVYIFGKHVEWNYILSLQDGMFIANNTDLWVAKRYYSVYLNMEIFIFILAFTGILFFLIWSAFVWKDYQDYAYLLYFGASFIFVAIIDRQLSSTLSQMGLFLHYTLRSLAWANALLAMTAFSFSTLRSSQRIQIIFLASFATLLSSSVFFNWYYCTEVISRSDLASRNVQFYYTAIAAFLPFLLCVMGAINCVRIKYLHLSVYARESEHLALNKRMRQQLVFAVFMMIFNWPSFENFLNLMSGGRPNTIFTLAAAAAYVGIFIALLRPPMLRLKRAIDLLDRVSEASTMRLLLSPKKYRDWKSRVRSGIFIEADIKGSTSAIPELNQSMHTVMKVLRQALQADLQKANRSILLAKPLGDAWVFIVTKHPEESLTEALVEAMHICQKNLQKYREILQSTQRMLLEDRRKAIRPEQAIGVHLRVFAIEKFFLQDRLMPNMKKITKKLIEEFNVNVNIHKTHDTELDFIGEESHLFLRYLPKAPSGFVSIAGQLQHLKKIDKSAKFEKHELNNEITLENQSQSFLKAKADELALSYMFVPAEEFSHAKDKNDLKDSA